MPQRPETVERIVLACCVLHNMLRTLNPRLTNHLVDYEDPATHQVQPGTWRDDEALTALQAMRGNTAARAAKGQRVYMRTYYNSAAGSVPWQDRMI